MKGIFVTGTDTNVGKTIVAAALAMWLKTRMEIGYWKPIQTGIETDDDTATVKQLARLDESEIFDQGIRLPKPLSPHLSARLAGVSIGIEQVLDFLPTADRHRFFIVEGAGGVLVPLNERELMIDLIAALKLPVVIAARSGLGTINHTCLTLEALKRRDIAVAGVILSGESNPENKAAIEHYGKTRILAEIPHLANLPNDFPGILPTDLIFDELS